MRQLLTIIASVVLALGIQQFVLDKPSTSLTTQKTKTQSVYDRVTTSKTLRCGYITWPTFSEKNVNTGKMKGMYIDLTEDLAKAYGWKVEWVEEVALPDFVTALNSNRIDMMCAPMAPALPRPQFAYFSRSQFYAPYRAYVRAGDMRFDNNLAAINSADNHISTMEGELTSIVARTNYPQAKVVEISAQQGAAQLLENVATGKADVVFQDPFTFAGYNAANPNKLRQVQADDVAVFYAAYAIKFGEDDFKWVIDAAINQQINHGYIAKLAKDYNLIEAGIYLTADEYKK